MSSISDMWDDVFNNIGYEARRDVLDVLAQQLFRFGHDARLSSANESSDVEWLAVALHRRSASACLQKQNWAALPGREQEIWRAYAFNALDTLPELLERIALRCTTQTKLLTAMIRNYYRVKRETEEQEEDA